MGKGGVGGEGGPRNGGGDCALAPGNADFVPEFGIDGAAGAGAGPGVRAEFLPTSGESAEVLDVLVTGGRGSGCPVAPGNADPGLCAPGAAGGTDGSRVGEDFALGLVIEPEAGGVPVTGGSG